jgi:hypothetical protein
MVLEDLFLSRYDISFLAQALEAQLWPKDGWDNFG